MTHRWAHFGWSLVLPNALTKLQSLDRVHFRSGCSARGVTMTFLGPRGGLYRPPVDPVWARVFPEPCPSPVYPQVMQVLSFILVFLLFLLSVRPFRKNCPKFIFCTIFARGHPPPLSSPVRLLHSLGQPIFSFLWYDVVPTSHQRGAKCRHLKLS